ncbi:sulfotransferase [Sedimenticola thiotaurini]|uniref:Sulfotransferase n=1 Tax=Sedimenticola thiotaurini TaxID=1543721 RepID=A0A0F7JVT3_9GAMM|nr:sulfotransferase [Sedimenticola thiotaurini]AKH19697.1 hypothetical protein AAY24_04225 [Sedimenticola thiotaurini]
MDRIIFAYGSGRSGTTLLAKLIDSSRSVIYRHEPDKTSPNSDIPFLPEAEQYQEYADASRRYLEQLRNDRSAFVNGKKPWFEKRFRKPSGTLLRRFLIPAATLAEKAGLNLPIPDLAKDNNYTTVIKSVNSLGRVPMFAQALPEMKFIHIVRHPGAIIASQLRGIEQNKMGQDLFINSVSKMSNARNFSIDIETISTATFEEQSAYIWMVQNDKSFRELSDSPNYMLISYEDLCVNMPDRVEALCQFMGVPFDSQMQQFIATLSRTDGESGYFSVMKNPLANIDKWETTIDSDTAEKIVGIIGQSEIGRFVMEKYQAAKQSIANR